MLSWLAQRPAFDRRFVEAIQRPLVDALTSVRATDSELYSLIDEEIAEFGIRCGDNVTMTDVEVHVLSNVPLSDSVRAVVDTLWDTWESESRDQQLNLLPLQFAQLTEIPASTYINLTRVPLRGLSTDA